MSGYSDVEQPNDFTTTFFTMRTSTTFFTMRTAKTLESAEISFIGRIASDFFSCDKHLI